MTQRGTMAPGAAGAAPARAGGDSCGRRSVTFAVVGLLGFAVQLAALQVLAGHFGVPVAVATAGAVELALLHNFAWHERWTWRDRAAAAPGGTWRRLGRFHLGNGLVSLTGNLVMTSWLAGPVGVPVALANLLAAGACTVANFVAADQLVFRQESEVSA